MRHKRTGVVIIILLIIDITFTGLLKFGFNTVRCLGIPVAIDTPAFGVGSSSYWMPGKYTPGGAGTEYVCTEQEAKDRGIDRSPLQGPDEPIDPDYWKL